MEYLSTRNNQLRKPFMEVLFEGLSQDGGLFLPTKWPKTDISKLRNKTYEDLAFHIMHPYVEKEIPKNDPHKTTRWRLCFYTT